MKAPLEVAQLFHRLINAKTGRNVTTWKNQYLEMVGIVSDLRLTLKKHPRWPLVDVRLYRNMDPSANTYATFMRRWLSERRNGVASRGQSILSKTDFHKVINNSRFQIIARDSIVQPSARNYRRLTEWWYGNRAIANRPLLINRAFAACAPEYLSSTVDKDKFRKVLMVLKRNYNFRIDSGKNDWYESNSTLTKWLDVELDAIIRKESQNKLERQVIRNIFVWLVYTKFYRKPKLLRNNLIRTNSPNGKINPKSRSYNDFHGRDIDFEKVASEQRELGDAGEQLVMNFEIRQLRKWGMSEKLSKVRIARPGEGFDVFSFDVNGNDKFIEVKTTSGDRNSRFFLTRNEVNFMREHKSNFSLYRVYNYNKAINSGKFFEIPGDMQSRLSMDPVVFEVVVEKSTKVNNERFH